MEYEVRTTAVIVVPKGEPIFAEGATTVMIDDEATGEFLVLTQSDDSGDQSIRIDPEEWPTLRDAINRMHMQCREDLIDAAQLDALRTELGRDEEPVV
jgi:hypothetical protein